MGPDCPLTDNSFMLEIPWSKSGIGEEFVPLDLRMTLSKESSPVWIQDREHFQNKSLFWKFTIIKWLLHMHNSLLKTQEY